MILLCYNTVKISFTPSKTDTGEFCGQSCWDRNLKGVRVMMLLTLQMKSNLLVSGILKKMCVFKPQSYYCLFWCSVESGLCPHFDLKELKTHWCGQGKKACALFPSNKNFESIGATKREQTETMLQLCGSSFTLFPSFQ